MKHLKSLLLVFFLLLSVLPRHAFAGVKSYNGGITSIILSSPGTLIDLIGVNNVNSITGLKITGNLNGTDILTIRKMTNLQYLDLESGGIVNGGMSYYQDYTTSANVIGDYFFKDITNLYQVILPANIISIGSHAFDGMTNLETISIPNSVTSIGSSAFYGCSGLTSVTIPNSVTSIAESTFYGCTGLTSVTIPNSVTLISSNAFSGCTGLTSVTIGKKVNVLHHSAFDGCTGLTSVIWNCRFIDMNYTKDSRPFKDSNNILSFTFGNEVYNIPQYLCYGLTSLTSVNIQMNNIGNYTSPLIGKSAFEGCTGLSRVDITDIAAWCKIRFVNAFANPLYYAHNLYLNGSKVTDLVIPNSVTKIENDAFYGCSCLTSATIPNSVTEIGKRAFSGCSGLTSVTIPNSVAGIYGSTFDGCTGLKNLKIKDGESFLKIYETAFANCPLDTLYLGRNLESSYLPFKGKTTIKNLTIGNKVTQIGASAFASCMSLTNLSLVDGNENLSLANSIENNPFANCPIETLYLGRNINCNYSPFKQLESLKSVTIGNSVNSVGDYAFYNCNGLTSVTIGNSVTSIGNYAFKNCSGLTSVTIGNSVTCIGNYAFEGCTGLTSVTIPNSVTSIGESAFNGCTGLSRVDITDIAAWCKIRFVNAIATPLYYAHNLYLNGSKVTDLVIPNSVTKIENDAFSYCTGLTSVTIPNSVTTIGESAFWGCTGLTSVIIGNSVTEIGKSAFSGCSGLTSVTIPNSVTSVGDYAFWGCKGLTSVTIPNSVTTIGSCAFSGCSGLTSVTIPNSVTSIGNYAFHNCKGLTSVTIGNSVTCIGNYAFEGCTGLTSVTIPNSVTSIGNYAFKNCSGLTSVIIGNSVTEIGKSAFSYCTGLTSVTIPNSVTTIGESAFWGCTGLTSVIIGNSVTEIGESAFWGCTGLTSVTIPNSVTKIGFLAFSGCNELKNLKLNDGANPLTTSSDSFANCPLVTLYLGRNINYYNQYSYSPFKQLVSLKSVTIGDSVTSISENAFAGCSGLSKVHSLNTTPPVITESTFDEETEQNASLLVPTGCQTIYWLHPYWENFTTIEEEEYYVTGDTNQDGFVTSADVTAIYDILLGVNNTYMDACDVNGDGYITSADVTAIYDILLGNQ